MLSVQGLTRRKVLYFMRQNPADGHRLYQSEKKPTTCTFSSRRSAPDGDKRESRRRRQRSNYGTMHAFEACSIANALIKVHSAGFTQSGLAL